MSNQKEEKYILDFKNGDGIRVVWEKESFEDHASKRPWLLDKAIQEKIMKARFDPDTIIRSHKKKASLCYYLKERPLGRGKFRYTKVIVKRLKKADYIESAFRPDVIKELKYHKPLWEKKN